jgi:hypothetical protein
MNAASSDWDDYFCYEIKIQGHLKERWASWLTGSQIQIDHLDGCENTIIKAIIRDQAALRGLLNKLWDLNLTLISVRLIRDR